MRLCKKFTLFDFGVFRKVVYLQGSSAEIVKGYRASSEDMWEEDSYIVEQDEILQIAEEIKAFRNNNP